MRKTTSCNPVGCAVKIKSKTRSPWPKFPGAKDALFSSPFVRNIAAKRGGHSLSSGTQLIPLVSIAIFTLVRKRNRIRAILTYEGWSLAALPRAPADSTVTFPLKSRCCPVHLYEIPAGCHPAAQQPVVLEANGTLIASIFSGNL